MSLQREYTAEERQEFADMRRREAQEEKAMQEMIEATLKTGIEISDKMDEMWRKLGF